MCNERVDTGRNRTAQDRISGWVRRSVIGLDRKTRNVAQFLDRFGQSCADQHREKHNRLHITDPARFQDHRHRPLGHPSASTIRPEFASLSQNVSATRTVSPKVSRSQQHRTQHGAWATCQFILPTSVARNGGLLRAAASPRSSSTACRAPHSSSADRAACRPGLSRRSSRSPRRRGNVRHHLA